MESFNSNYAPKAVDISNYSSVMATEPSERVSSKYLFIPTTQALEVLADHGWMPVKINQANTRIEANQGFQKHMIRLSNERYNRELSVGDTIPQMMLFNSHSGTSAFELSAALYRKVCANGLCVSESSLEAIKIRHIGYQDQSMSDACEKLAKALPDVLTEVEQFKQIELSREEQTIFAKSAIEMRFDGDKYTVEPAQVLQVRRWADDKSPSLWNTFNVVQENVIRGGVRQKRADGSRIRSKQVKNLTEDTKLNRALWTLQKEMAALKS